MVPPTERPPLCVIAERQERTAGSPLFTHTDSGHLHIRFTARQYAPSRFHLKGDVRLSCPRWKGPPVQVRGWSPFWAASSLFARRSFVASAGSAIRRSTTLRSLPE